MIGGSLWRKSTKWEGLVPPSPRLEIGEAYSASLVGEVPTASFCWDAGGCGQVPRGGALGWLVLGELWRVPVFLLGFCTFCPRMFSIVLPQPVPKILQGPRFCTLPMSGVVPRSGTAVPSLLGDLEHESARPWACVPLCAKRRQISDP